MRSSSMSISQQETPRFLPLELVSVRETSVARVVGDSVLAFIFLLVLLPAVIVIAAMIRLTSRGPAFFIQDRIGLNGEHFRFIKFRTMENGAEKQRQDVLGAPDDEMLERYIHDPRITRVGRFLRRWSVDELPQLVNVIRGEMSLVGPRPMLPEEVVLLAPPHHDRHLCRPGLTGLWQVSGRKETSFERRMNLDLEYVQTHSFIGDATILSKTVRVVLRGHGAY